MKKNNISIEFPSIGKTYARNEYAVYEYDRYPRGSVNYGKERRSFLDSFRTLEEARVFFPNAVESIGTPISEEWD
jgi:hypothetical protein